MTGWRVKALRGGARNQFDDVHRPRGVRIEDLVDRIERSTSPVDAAAGHRKNRRPLRRGRRVEALVARRGKLLAADRAIPEGDEADYLVRRNLLRRQYR